MVRNTIKYRDSQYKPLEKGPYFHIANSDLIYFTGTYDKQNRPLFEGYEKEQWGRTLTSFTIANSLVRVNDLEHLIQCIEQIKIKQRSKDQSQTTQTTQIPTQEPTEHQIPHIDYTL